MDRFRQKKNTCLGFQRDHVSADSVPQTLLDVSLKKNKKSSDLTSTKVSEKILIVHYNTPITQCNDRHQHS